jgi:prevent-host-death family protein
MGAMTLHLKNEVGVRELHDHLSKYVQRVAAGDEVIVTMRGKPVARLSPIDQHDPLAELRRLGLVRDPIRAGKPPYVKPIKTAGTVSDLIAEQRR